MPFEKVEVAVVEVRFKILAVSPPVNVLVPELVTVRSPEERIFPPVRVSPFEERSPPEEIPFTNVEVPVPWTLMVEVAVNPCTVVVPRSDCP